jgi:FkbM family methyltransferase
MPYVLEAAMSNLLSGWLHIWHRMAGIRSFEHHSFYAPAIMSESTIVDLGANRGNFSLQMVLAFGCESYAAEPIPALYNALPRHERIHNFNCAITDKNGPVMFYVSDNEEMHSTSRDIAATGGLRQSITVEGVTIGTFLQRIGVSEIDLLKCDIEGAEFNLFKTFSDEELKRLKQCTVEFHDFLERISYPEEAVEGIRHRMEALGFIYLPMSARGSINNDILFINKWACKVRPSAWLALSVLRTTYLLLKLRHRLKHRAKAHQKA